MGRLLSLPNRLNTAATSVCAACAATSEMAAMGECKDNTHRVFTFEAQRVDIICGVVV